MGQLFVSPALLAVYSLAQVVLFLKNIVCFAHRLYVRTTVGGQLKELEKSELEGFFFSFKDKGDSNR